MLHRIEKPPTWKAFSFYRKPSNPKGVLSLVYETNTETLYRIEGPPTWNAGSPKENQHSIGIRKKASSLEGQPPSV